MNNQAFFFAAKPDKVGKNFKGAFLMDLHGKKVVLIDGSGYIFRAFYALPPMTRPSDNTPVNAVYGFCSMMMKLLKDMPADYIAVVFDAARKTFRQDIYPDYKATRRETPPELIPQFPLLRQAVAAFNLAQTEMEGYEADDLLATYSRLANEAGADVTVVSADKDLMQLVGGRIVVFDPMKQRVVDRERVLEKFGVDPEQVVDVQALMGDSSDNVPGVPGIGPKSAAQLITEYGTLENLFANITDAKPSRKRDLLIEHKDKALISQKLVKLDAFAPVSANLESFAAKPANPVDLSAFLTDMGFKSLVAKVPHWVSDEQKAMLSAAEIKTDYRLVQTPDALRAVVAEAMEAGVVALATQTDLLPPLSAKLIGFSLSFKDGAAYYVPLRHNTGAAQTSFFEEIDPESRQIPPKQAIEILLPLLENKGVLKVGYNIKSDWHLFAKEAGRDFDLAPFADVKIMCYDLDGTSHYLELYELTELFLDHKMISYNETCRQGRVKVTFDFVTVKDGYRLVAEKADMIYRLYGFLHKRMVAEHRIALYEQLDRAAVPVLYEMERAGIKINGTELHALSATFGERIKAMEARIYAEAGEEFNLNSPAQLGTVLFEKLKLPNGKKSKTGTWVTEAAILDDLAEQGYQIAADILEYRQYSKLKSTYTDALQAQTNPQTGRIHTTFMQTGTLTGRLSSNDPNLQNIPIRTQEGREIRHAFIAEKGNVLLSADYSQVELRLMAHVANVARLKEAIIQGVDIHASTASHIFNIPIEGMDPMVRRSAKAINFGIIYGMSAFGLARQLGIERSEAQRYIDSYFEKYPEIKAYMESTIAFAKANGYVLTPFGRKCFVGAINDKNPHTRQFAERSAINAPVQGGAADILKKAMIRMPDALKSAGLSAKMLLQVHDELVFEVPEDQAQKTAQTVKDVMENIVSLSVPLIADVGIGPNWAEAH